MNAIKPLITFEEARSLVAQSARSHLEHHIDDQTMDPLDPDRYLEAEHCWMFFRNPKIVVPEQDWFMHQAAFASSKRGTRSIIHDFSPNLLQLQDYLQKLSEYFGRRQE